MLRREERASKQHQECSHLTPKNIWSGRRGSRGRPTAKPELSQPTKERGRQLSLLAGPRPTRDLNLVIHLMSGSLVSGLLMCLLMWLRWWMLVVHSRKPPWGQALTNLGRAPHSWTKAAHGLPESLTGRSLKAKRTSKSIASLVAWAGWAVPTTES